MSEKKLNFLVAIGFSEKPEDVLKKAVDVARKYKARVYAIHVIAEMPKLTFYYDAYKLWDDFRESAIAEAMDVMKKYIGKMADDYRDIQPIIEVGEPGVKILEKARELDVDLIIMGHHVRSGFTHLLHQNSCEHVVRYSEIPVLMFNVAGETD